MSENNNVVAVAMKQAIDDTYIMQLPQVGGTVGILLSIVMGVAYVLSKLRKNGKIDSAEGDLYKQLSEQVAKQKLDLDKAFEERNLMVEKISRMSVRVDRLEACEEAMINLKVKLDQKDDSLRDRDTDNRNLMLEIMALKDRIHQLEMRLTADERSFCVDCQRRTAAI